MPQGKDIEEEGDEVFVSTNLDDLADAATGFLEDGLHALAGCLGLVADAALD